MREGPLWVIMFYWGKLNFIGKKKANNCCKKYRCRVSCHDPHYLRTFMVEILTTRVEFMWIYWDNQSAFYLSSITTLNLIDTWSSRISFMSLFEPLHRAQILSWRIYSLHLYKDCILIIRVINWTHMICLLLLEGDDYNHNYVFILSLSLR